MVAVVGVDTELADDLVGVFAPVLDVDEGVVQRRAVVAGEGIDLAEGLGGGEDIGRDDLFKQAGELGVGEADAVEGLELFAEVGLEGGAVVDVGADGVFEVAELLNEQVLDVLLPHDEFPGFRCSFVSNSGGHQKVSVRKRVQNTSASFSPHISCSNQDLIVHG